MPRFKTNQNIFKDMLELTDENSLDKPTLVLPPNKKWDYSRDLKIEDIDIWEVIYEQGGAVGVYAAWEPYAEFYMIRVGWQLEAQGWGVETYYGPGSMNMVVSRCKELSIPICINEQWVEPEDMWLYQS